jgi:hypothetical protein
MKKEIKIILPMLSACADRAYCFLPYVIDACLPSKIFKRYKFFEKLPYRFHNLPKPRSEKFIQGKKYFDGYELLLELHGLLDRDWNIIEEKLNKYLTKKYPIYAVHGVLFGDSFENKYLKFRMDYHRRNRFKKAFKNQVLIAKKLCLNDPILILHTNELFRPSKKSFKEAQKRIVSNLKTVKPYLEKHQVYLAIENNYDYADRKALDAHPKFLKEILVNLDSKFIKINFDLGHANNQARIEYEKNKISKRALRKFDFLFNFLEILKGEIIYSHVSYNNNHLKKNFNTLFDLKANLKKNFKFDQHLPLNFFDSQSLPRLEELFIKMIRENPIQKVCLEITPQKFFKFLKTPQGGTPQDFNKSAKMLRLMLEKQS